MWMLVCVRELVHVRVCVLVCEHAWVRVYKLLCVCI